MSAKEFTVSINNEIYKVIGRSRPSMMCKVVRKYMQKHSNIKSFTINIIKTETV